MIATIEAAGSAGDGAAAAPAAAPAATAAQQAPAAPSGDAPAALSPSVRRAVLEHGVDPSTVKGTGKDGRITKEDVVAAAAAPAPVAAPAAAAEPAIAPSVAASTGRKEERVRMTRLRQTVAKRLKEAQNTAAMLTTFNDVDS